MVVLIGCTNILLLIADSPSIISVKPPKVVKAETYNNTTLTCNAEGNPPPRYQWLQKLPTHEVLIRGYNHQLFIENVTYEHQGEYVCKAINEINGETRSVQSDPITLEVTGAPQIMSPFDGMTIGEGQDATLWTRFCADPLPEQLWHLGGSGDNIILAAGTTHGRFVAESVRKEEEEIKEDCYVSSLRINEAHPTDSNVYELRLTNAHGTDSYKIDLKVKGK